MPGSSPRSPAADHLPQLSSIQGSLDELVRRLDSIRAALEAARQDDPVGAELGAVERQLATANRRLERLLSRI